MVGPSGRPTAPDGRVPLILAVLGALLVAYGVALVAVPAAFVVAGVELIAGGYVLRYLRVHR